MINNYNEFITALLEVGFSMGSGNNDGVFSLISHNWNDAPGDSLLRWHTECPETDPWEWRMRVLEEREDIAYSKFFFKKTGYITKEWYPYFIAVRRGGKTFADEYGDGKMSHYAKRIYNAIAEHGILPLEEIKRYGGFTKEEKSKFDSGLVELQMKLFVTMCGRSFSRVVPYGNSELDNKSNDDLSSELSAPTRGWASTVFCTTENFWSEDMFAQAATIPSEEATGKITAHVLKYNPEADMKKVAKFIRG